MSGDAARDSFQSALIRNGFEDQEDLRGVLRDSSLRYSVVIELRMVRPARPHLIARRIIVTPSIMNLVAPSHSAAPGCRRRRVRQSPTRVRARPREKLWVLSTIV